MNNNSVNLKILNLQQEEVNAIKNSGIKIIQDNNAALIGAKELSLGLSIKVPTKAQLTKKEKNIIYTIAKKQILKNPDEEKLEDNEMHDKQEILKSLVDLKNYDVISKKILNFDFSFNSRFLINENEDVMISNIFEFPECITNIFGNSNNSNGIITTNIFGDSYGMENAIPNLSREIFATATYTKIQIKINSCFGSLDRYATMLQKLSIYKDNNEIPIDCKAKKTNVPFNYKNDLKKLQDDYERTLLDLKIQSYREALNAEFLNILALALWIKTFWRFNDEKQVQNMFSKNRDFQKFERLKDNLSKKWVREALNVKKFLYKKNNDKNLKYIPMVNFRGRNTSRGRGKSKKRSSTSKKTKSISKKSSKKTNSKKNSKKTKFPPNFQQSSKQKKKPTSQNTKKKQFKNYSSKGKNTSQKKSFTQKKSSKKSKRKL